MLIVALSLIFLGYAKIANGQNDNISYPVPQTRLVSVIQAQTILPEAIQSPVSDFSSLEVKHIGNDCLTTLKRENLMPDGAVTTDGYARTVATKPVDLKPGMQRVVCTTEGYQLEDGTWSGHCLEVWINEEGEAISTTEGGHSIGVGRIVDIRVIIGEAILAIAR